MAAGLAGLVLLAGGMPDAAHGAENTPPVAVDDPGAACGNTAFGGSFPIAEDWSDWFVLFGSCGPLTNDSDPDGDPLTFELVGQPAHGEAVSQPDGFLAYRVEPDYSTPGGDTAGGTWVSDVITYRDWDGIAYSEPASYRLWIAPVNDPPSFTPGPALVEASALGGPVSVAWASDIVPGPANEAGQTVSFEIVGLEQPGAPAMFAVPPAIDGDGVLTFTPGSAPGLATVTVQARDDGGLEDYGLLGRPQFVPPDDTSDPVAFQIAIGPAAPAPLVATLAAPASPTNAPILDYAVTFSEPVAGLDSGDFSLAGSAAGCSVGTPSGSEASYVVSLSGCADGTVTLVLAADSVTDGGENPGPASPVSADPVTVDRTVPGTSSLGAAPQIGAVLNGRAIPLRVTWQGGDTSGGSGIAAYELARSRDGGTTWTTISSSLITRSAVDTAPSSSGVRYRVRAVDLAGNRGAWANGRSLRPRLVQESSTAVTYSGTWATSRSGTFSGGSATYSRVAGRAATFTFTGRSIALVTTMAAARGRARIYVNGRRAATVDLHSATSRHRVLAWRRTWSRSGTRTVKLVVVGTSGHPRVDLDAFVVVK